MRGVGEARKWVCLAILFFDSELVGSGRMALGMRLIQRQNWRAEEMWMKNRLCQARVPLLSFSFPFFPSLSGSSYIMRVNAALEMGAIPIEGQFHWGHSE